MHADERTMSQFLVMHRQMPQMSYPITGEFRYPQTPSHKSLMVSELRDKADNVYTICYN
jgi:hypothetical protein